MFHEAKVGLGMRSTIGDIRDLASISNAVERARPEIIFHLAAQPLVRESYLSPVETYATNVMGTVNLLEAARKTSSVTAFINVTTDKCYENKEWVWPYRESDALGGHDPYSSSKACSEMVTDSWRRSFCGQSRGESTRPLSLASARAGNVIGGGDWASERLIPDTLRAFSEGRAVVIRNPHAVRPWQHVMEPLWGYLLLGQRLLEVGMDYSEAWNFGPCSEDARPVEWLVERMADLWQEGARWARDSSPQPHEANLLKLDTSKSQARLQWTPKLDLSTALEWTIFWAKAWKAGDDMRRITLSQIEAYEKLN
jgi:CDP-glucose 4,6-dehydratase